LGAGEASQGEIKASAYDPTSGTFSDLQNMAHGRWYPTAITLGDGTVMTFSGLTETGNTNTAVEIFTPGLGWSQEYVARWTPPLYPRMHLLSNGTVFHSGSTPVRIFLTHPRALGQQMWLKPITAGGEPMAHRCCCR
jgi:hypothetical protein